VSPARSNIMPKMIEPSSVIEEDGMTQVAAVDFPRDEGYEG
jgi:hypothetical protein